MQTLWDFSLSMRCESSRLMKKCTSCWRTKMYLLLEEPKSSTSAAVWAAIAHFMTFISVLVVILETLPSMRCPPPDSLKGLFVSYNSSSSIMSMMTGTMPLPALLIIENITVLFLTIELIMRFAVSPKKKRFFLNILNICDLLSLIPCYAIALLLLGHSVWDSATSVARVMVILGIARIIRIFRLIHLAKTCQTVYIIAASLVDSYRELGLLLIMLVCGSVFFASLLFYSELHVDNIDSIPLAIWWAMITMMTVGYGDYQPISGGGYFVACMCSIAGILIIALPTPIVVNNFSRLYDTYQTCQLLAERQKIGSDKPSRKNNSLSSKICPMSHDTDTDNLDHGQVKYNDDKQFIPDNTITRNM